MYTYLALLLGRLVLHQANALNVSIYYETYNESSTDFLLNQFFPALEILKDYVDTDLIPYGLTDAKLNKDGTYTYNCTGRNDMCYGNLYHACALRPPWTARAYDFIKCNLQNPILASSISVEPIKQCAPVLAHEKDSSFYSYLIDYGFRNKDNIGRKALEIEMGKTMELEPELDHVPTIVFDGHYDCCLEQKAMHNFLQTACELLTDKPSGC